MNTFGTSGCRYCSWAFTQLEINLDVTLSSEQGSSHRFWPEVHANKSFTWSLRTSPSHLHARWSCCRLLKEPVLMRRYVQLLILCCRADKWLPAALPLTPRHLRSHPSAGVCAGSHNVAQKMLLLLLLLLLPLQGGLISPPQWLTASEWKFMSEYFCAWEPSWTSEVFQGFGIMLDGSSNMHPEDSVGASSLNRRQQKGKLRCWKMRIMETWRGKFEGGDKKNPSGGVSRHLWQNNAVERRFLMRSLVTPGTWVTWHERCVWMRR